MPKRSTHACGGAHALAVAAVGAATDQSGQT